MKLSGELYRNMLISGACCLDNDKETVNNLNVFPVPDGDTGINMSMTIGSVRGEFSNFVGPIGETAQKAANLMLRSARGNSGVILSLFFRGISKAWKTVEEADCLNIVEGFEKGVSEAYKAVMNPTEGTILTVMREMTECARNAIDKGEVDDIIPLFVLMYDEAKKSLERTPDLLPQLKMAGVVDSGGYGFCDVINGMIQALQGNPVVAIETNSNSNVAMIADFSNFDTADIKYAYCTECIVTKNDKYQGENTAEDLHQFIMSLGDSVVFVDDAEIIKLHVHTNNPGKVLSEAIRYGMLYTVKIENMKFQHSNLSSGASKENKSSNAQNNEESKEEEDNSTVEITKKYGFVTVCMGEGLESMFKDLNADVVVSGGQTMNPSTENIVNAVESTPAEVVFVLPNNKNICMVAHQAERIAKDRKVIVIETVSVPEGVSAMLAFDETADEETNTANMNNAKENVTTLSTTYAVRDTEIGDTKIKKGEVLGLYNGKIICTSDDRIICINGLLSKYEDDPSYISVYTGEGSTEDETKVLEDYLNEQYPDADIVILDGGQPVYSYIISLE